MMEQNGMYAEEYGENGYMEQEEEWEREGLLDPAWEKQQKKVGFNLIFPAFLRTKFLKKNCEPIEIE
jgi:hypothetical protein